MDLICPVCTFPICDEDGVCKCELCNDLVHTDCWKEHLKEHVLYKSFIFDEKEQKALE